MENKLFRALMITGVLLLPARNGPAESFGFTFQTRWSVPGGTTVHNLAFSPDGRWLAAAVGSQVKIFELKADDPAHDGGTVSLGRPEVTGLAFSPDGKTIAVVDESGTLSLFESTSLKELARVAKAHSGRASCVTFTGDGTYVVTGGRDGKVKVWTSRGEFFAELSRGAQHKGEILMVSGLAGGRQVLSIGKDHQVILWQIDTQQAIRPMSIGNDVRSAAVGGDGKTLALGLQLLSGNRFRSAPMGSLAHEIKADNTLRLIDTQNGTQLRDILGEEQDLDAVGVTPDGRFVAAGGSGHSTSIWDTATGQRINAIPSDAPLTAISFAPDGKRMALGASDGSLSLYHLSGVGPALRARPPSTVVIVILQPSELVGDDGGAHRGEIPKVHSPTLRLQGEIKTGAAIKSLLVNGTEITSLQPDGSGSYRFNAYVPVTEPGQHRFEVVAENVENIVARQSFVVERASDAPQSPHVSGSGRRIALIVGISRYANPTINLQYAADDARSLYQLLTNPALGPAAFHPEDVRLLLDEKATTSAINTGLRDFLQKARENDFVLFFFAGHGAPDPNRLLDLYLLAHDTDPDNIAGTGLLMEHVRDSISQIPARDVLILSDACHGAGMGGIAGMRGVKENPIHQAFLEKLRHASGGLAILTASEAAQSSYENAKWGKHGVFTHFLLQGLQGDADADHDGIVSLDEIMEYVRDRVRSATESRQIPAIGPTSFDRQLPLSIVIPQNPPNHSNPHPPGR
jgi:WD40 repeat protein